MKRIISRFPITFSLPLIFLLMLTYAAVAMEERTKVTIIGEVNDESQIVARDGTVYKIAETEKGNEVTDLIAAVIEATGTVIEEAGIKILFIESYKILEQI